MSSILPTRPRQAAQRRTFAVVASEYHPELVRGLIENAERELLVISPNFQVLHFAVPGAFEIPLVVQQLAQRNDIDAIIALGVIIEGETQHANLISSTLTTSLQKISLSFQVPVIHEVLLVKDEAQARERCLGEKINRGVEAARVAARMVQVMAEVRAKR